MKKKLNNASLVAELPDEFLKFMKHLQVCKACCVPPNVNHLC